MLKCLVLSIGNGTVSCIIEQDAGLEYTQMYIFNVNKADTKIAQTNEIEIEKDRFFKYWEI